MKFKLQIVFFILLLGLTGCLEKNQKTEQLPSINPNQPIFSAEDAENRLEKIIEKLDEEDEIELSELEADEEAQEEESSQESLKPPKKTQRYEGDKTLED
jgi:Skp family chaperone for outer membrane proteins